MGRNQSNNADYYYHSNSMRNHRKVKMLRNKFGSVLGYAFWCMMLEWLTEHDGLEWEFSDIEIEMFASELGISATEIPPMIDFCLKIGMLFKTSSDFIYSESLNENLQALFEKRNRERERSKDRKRKEDGTFLSKNSTSEVISATEIPLREEKRSKVNKSKEKIVPPTIEEVKEYFTEKGYSLDVAQKAFDYYASAGWKDSNGKEVKSWKQKMISIWFKDENKNNQSRQAQLVY